MRLPEKDVVLHCIQLCSDRFEKLVADGVDENVALDRTYDAYEKAITYSKSHVSDQRDSLFETKLRNIIQKG